MQFAIVGDDVVVGGGGCGGGGSRHTTKIQMIKNGGGIGHQTCEYCLKTTQLGQVTLSIWKCQISKGPEC